MAVRVVNVNDTIETLRSTFNSHATDTGDLTNLDTTDKSSLVAAVNEAKAGTSQFTLRDASSTTQTIEGGDTLNVVGSGGVSMTVSVTDTLTASLDSTITGLTSLTSTALVGSTSVTAGTLFLTENRIRTTDSSLLTLNDSVTVSSGGAIASATTISGTTISGTTLAASSDVTINSVSVATKPFAIAQAIALG